MAHDLTRIDEPCVAAKARVNAIQNTNGASTNETIPTNNVDSDR